MTTKKQLQRFAAIRSGSGYSSNLQFQIDLEGVGLRLKDLGPAEKFTLEGFVGYRWNVETSAGPQVLIEFGRGMCLLADNAELADLIARKAVFVATEPGQ